MSSIYEQKLEWISLQKKDWDNKDSVLFKKFPTIEKFNKYIKDELKSFIATLKLPSDFQDKFQYFSDNFNVLTDKLGYQSCWQAFIPIAKKEGSDEKVLCITLYRCINQFFDIVDIIELKALSLQSIYNMHTKKKSKKEKNPYPYLLSDFRPNIPTNNPFGWNNLKNTFIKKIMHTDLQKETRQTYIQIILDLVSRINTKYLQLDNQNFLDDFILEELFLEDKSEKFKDKIFIENKKKRLNQLFINTEPLNFDDYSQTNETYLTFPLEENWNNVQFHSIDKTNVPDSKIWYLFENDNIINSFNDPNQGNFSKIKLSFDVKNKLDHFEMSIIMKEVFKIKTNYYIYPYDYRNNYFKDISLDDICSTRDRVIMDPIFQRSVRPDDINYFYLKYLDYFLSANDRVIMDPVFQRTVRPDDINYFYLKKKKVYYSISKSHINIMLIVHPDGVREYYHPVTYQLVRTEFPDYIKVYEGEKGHEHVIRTELPNGRKQFYEGEKGYEHLVRIEFPNGQKQFYEGGKGNEHHVRSEFPNVHKVFYEGEKGNEHHVRTKFPNGEKLFYEGEKGNEHHVRTKFPNGEKHFYEGEKGNEHLVRIKLPNGEIQFYEGEKNNEHVIRIESPDGEIQFYEGEINNEHLVRIEYLDTLTNKKVFYEGEKNNEHVIRIESPDGEIQFYEGEINNEHLVRIEYLDTLTNKKLFYEGEKGNEHLVRTELPNGEKQFYEGEKDNEHLVRIELPNGEKRFYEVQKKGNEHLVRIELPNGGKRFYEGEKGNEHLVRIEVPNGGK
jgi:hypothetical protein